MVLPGSPFPVLVHPYQSPVRGACAYEQGNTSAQNALIFVGGLKDGPHTVPYIRTVAEHLQESATGVDYSVFEIRLRSSFIGFGSSSLTKDVADISALVKYLRGIGREKIVLFGHSTGCQDCMEYSNYAKHNNEPVDGFILQAPVSDREGIENMFPEYQKSLDLAAQMIADGRANDYLPRACIPGALGAPVTAYRLQSLWKKGGDDDYFSSDLDDETVSRLWSRFKKPVLVLHSEEDEFVPPECDQEALNTHYRDANLLVSPLSGLIPNTGHTVLEEEPRLWVAEKTAQFLERLM